MKTPSAKKVWEQCQKSSFTDWWEKEGLKK
jgi:hypothetical protein